jgi:ACS family pantothenate transporter-like MFS transporter
MAWIPLVWFQQVHQPFVTAGNRAAAVIAGFNILIFSTIAFLAHRERQAKKRNHELSAPVDPEPATPSDEGGEKDVSVGVQAIGVQKL